MQRSAVIILEGSTLVLGESNIGSKTATQGTELKAKYWQTVLSAVGTYCGVPGSARINSHLTYYRTGIPINHHHQAGGGWRKKSKH